MNKLLQLLIFIALFFHANILFAQSDIETVKQRVFKSLIEREVNNNYIEKLLVTFDEGKWPGINYEDTTRTGFEHRYHSDNMVALARAYKKSGSKYAPYGST